MVSISVARPPTPPSPCPLPARWWKLPKYFSRSPSRRRRPDRQGVYRWNLAGGLQATAVQFGGVLGASVLGTIIANRPRPCSRAAWLRRVSTRWLAAASLSPRSPFPRGTWAGTGYGSAQVQAAVAAGSHAACTFGFHEVLAVGGTIALAGGVPGVFIPAR